MASRAEGIGAEKSRRLTPFMRIIIRIGTGIRMGGSREPESLSLKAAVPA